MERRTMTNKEPIFLELNWNPKADITVDELAFCLPYILNNSYLTDFSLFEEKQQFFRHFDVVKHYEPIFISDNYSIDPRKEDDIPFVEGAFYKWNPKNDITIYEIACSIPIIKHPNTFFYEEKLIDRHFDISHLPLKSIKLPLSPKGGYGFKESHTFFEWIPQEDITLKELLDSFPYIKKGIWPTKDVDLTVPFLRHFKTWEHKANITAS